MEDKHFSIPYFVFWTYKEFNRFDEIRNKNRNVPLFLIPFQIRNKECHTVVTY